MSSRLRDRFGFRLLVVAPAVVAAVYSTLWACAPAASMIAPVPLSSDAPSEFTMMGAAAYVAAEQQPVQDCPLLCWDGGLAYMRRLGPAGALGFNVAGGQTTLVGAGMLARVNLADRDDFAAALQLQGGWPYGGLNLALSGRISQDTWVYVAPGGVVGPSSRVELPIGMSADLGGVGGTWLVSGQVAGFTGPGTDFGANPPWPIGLRASVLVSFRFKMPGDPPNARR